MSVRVADERAPRVDAAIAPGALDPQLLLAAIEGYQGSFLDLDDGLTVEPASFARVRESLRRDLSAIGVASGDRVVIAIGNGPRFVSALDAVLRRGAHPLLLHYQMPAAELLRVAGKYEARYLLVDTPETCETLAANSRITTLDHDWLRCQLAALKSARATSGGAAAHGGWADLPATPLHPTSGSTNEPKIAVRPGQAAVAEAINYLSAVEIGRDDALLTVTPMSHAYAYGMGMLVPLLSHAHLVSLRRFAVKPVLAALKNERITIFPAAPAMLDMLMFGQGAELLARPRMVLSAGSPLTRRTVERFERIARRRIYPLYGTTETGGITIGANGVTADCFQSVGPPLRGVEAKIVATGDSTFGSGVGRVAIRSTSMMAGYLSPTGIDRGSLDDGWFLTGDVGRVIAGEIHLLGRESDVINVGGLKVVPSEVEEVIADFPGVVECKVYAGGAERKSPFVKAAVVADPSFDFANLRSHCAQQLVYYKQPTVYVRLDRLPRSAAGKIIKEQLP